MLRLLMFLIFIYTPLSLVAQINLEGGGEFVKEIPLKDLKGLHTEDTIDYNSLDEQEFLPLKDLTKTSKRDNYLYVKLLLFNSSLKEANYYLGVNTFIAEMIVLESDHFSCYKNGILVAKSKRMLPFYPEKFFVNIAAGQTQTIYFKFEIKPYNHLPGSITVRSEQSYMNYKEAHNQYTQSTIYFLLIYLSALVIVFIFVLFLNYWMRDKIYTYYLLYLVFQILYGYSILTRMPINLGVWGEYSNLSYSLTEPFQFVFIAFYILFIKELLSISANKWLSKIMNALVIFCLVYVGLFIFAEIFVPSITYTNSFIIYARIIVLPLNFILFLWIVLKVKHPLIYYFTIAHLLFFVGAVLSVYIYSYRLYVDSSSIFYFSNSQNIVFQAGLLGEVVFFSLALSYRVRLIQEGKIKKTNAYIQQLQKNQELQEQMNLKLDQKVEEKTKELSKLYAKMEKQKEKELHLEFSQKLNEAENMALRSQMNPHFLFNSMNAIKYMIMKEENEQASYYLDEFSSLLRLVLLYSRKELVSVEDELTLLKLYLSLEKMRLGEEFNYIIDIDDVDLLSQYNIPALLLQPFVENAIWHGLAPSDKASKILVLRFNTKANLIIEIEDNGIGRHASYKNKIDDNWQHRSLGIKMVEERLALFNQLSDFNINFKIVDKMEKGISEGTLIRFEYSI